MVVVSSDFEELLGLCDRIVAISDGASIADLPAGLLTEEKLTLLAAPRTSTARNTRLLRDLAETGGAGFWALLDREDDLPQPRGNGCLRRSGVRHRRRQPIAETRIPTP